MNRPPELIRRLRQQAARQMARSVPPPPAGPQPLAALAPAPPEPPPGWTPNAPRVVEPGSRAWKHKPGNITTAELRNFTRNMMGSCLDRVQDVLDDPDSSDASILTAVQWVADRAYGKAVQPVEVGGPGMFDAMNDGELEDYASALMLKIQAMGSHA